RRSWAVWFYETGGPQARTPPCLRQPQRGIRRKTGADPEPSRLNKENALLKESRYNNPESDKLLAEATDFEVVGNNKEKRKDIYLKGQKLWNKDVPVIPLVELEDIPLVRNKVKNFEDSLKGSNTANKGTVEK
ncbi:hypothetical protein ACEE31_12520, partial [Staphylococcus simulans]